MDRSTEDTGSHVSHHLRRELQIWKGRRQDEPSGISLKPEVWCKFMVLSIWMQK